MLIFARAVASACLNRFAAASLLVLVVSILPAKAAPTYLGLYMRNHKIGYASYSTHPVHRDGVLLQQSDTHTVMQTGLLGTPLNIVIDTQTWLAKDNSPIEMDFQTKSDGRTQTVAAHIGRDKVTVQVNNTGSINTMTLKKPDGLIVDDPMNLVLTHQKARKCFILDPTTVSFVENEVQVVGTKTVTINGKSVQETIIDVIDPRATTRAYLDSKNNLIRAEGPMGITMLPETEAVAMAKAEKYSPKVDLGYSTSIVPSGKIANPAETTELKMVLTGRDLSKTPNDDAQTLTGSGTVWTLDIHPPRLSKGISIGQARTEKPSFTKPDLDVPSDLPKFKKLAKQIVGGKTNTVDAALAIKDWVFSEMRPNAGIGVLRDASEVLSSKEGVCRDYAILTATLLRSAGIPTRLASGLVNWDGTFYYHAWDEIWDGHHWLGIDSTTPDKQISAAHIKLAQGTVAEAFTFAVLDHVSIKILSSQE